MRGPADLNPDFRCMHCDTYVSAWSAQAGVRHRNHCPYCLWSRHLDLYAAGDRLSACKAPMEPVGLTFKRQRKKYGRGSGELMLVHRCMGCGALSINRIAADDLGEVVLDVLAVSARLAPRDRRRMKASGIQMLTAAERAAVCRQLFGRAVMEG